MSLQAGNDTNGIMATPAESSIDITMTTPETTITTTTSTPLPEQQQLQQQVDPRIVATRQKVVDIIDHQFDLEILLRHAEGASIAQELAKTERMLEDLRHAILSGTWASTSSSFFFVAFRIVDQSSRRTKLTSLLFLV